MAQLLRLSAGMIDLATGAFDRDGQTVQLIGKELALLRYFARKADVVVPREELYTEVWGYAPQVQSRTLDVTLHKLRTKIELDPSNPVHLLTIVGEGYRFFPLPEPVARNTSALFGRRQEMDWLRHRLATERLVSIVGPGGIGKTRLMMEASVETELQVVGVDLANQDRVDLAVAQIGSELGDAEQGFAAAVALGDVWLFIDNVEQLLPDFAGAVSDALARVPQLRILVTSRRPLGLLTEALIPLGPLDSEAAQALFLDRALRRDPNYLADPMQLSQIVKVLDYWPLAIEVAAARSRLYPIGELVARMKSGVDLLEVTEADRPERHRSLRGALDWSWQLLSDAEKQALVALAAFPDGFSMAAAEHVLGPRASDRVLALIEHSWCWRADDGRFRMLAPAREFAVAHADGRVREQVCAWFASLVPEDLLERVHLGEPLIDQWRRDSAGLELGL